MNAFTPTQPGAAVFARPADGGWLEVVPGENARMLVRSQQVGGRYMLSEHVMSPGSGPPLHSHEQEEVFLIIEGVATFVVGNERIEATAGDVLSVPAGVAHTWANLTDQPIRMHVLFMPGGLEDFLFGVAGLSTPEIVALAGRFGVQVLGPPIS